MYFRAAVWTFKQGNSFLLFTAIVLCLIAFLPGPLPASDIKVNSAYEPEEIEVFAGKTAIIESRNPIDRVYVAKPEIANADVFSPRELAVTGNSPGSTTMTVWQEGRKTALYVIKVKYDITELKEKLHAAFPEEEDLRVQATHKTISLSGRISSAANLSEILAIAGTYAPEEKVNNFIQVGGVHQVMLDVRVAEMGKSLIRRMGINFSYAGNSDFFVDTLAGLSTLDSFAVGGGASPQLDFSFSDAVNMIFSLDKGSWIGFIDALKNEGLVKVLAEPTLIAQSGQSAYFLAGGEFPIPVPQENNTITIVYKEFGVGLSFTPKVLEKGRINIQVQPEVSELDFTTSIQSGGVAVPGLTTRRASTTVELADGQSFAIAGLMRESIQDNVEKFPWLGDIPVLGNLFRSKSFQKNETELVIVVTPHLVKPLDMAEQTLPTDHYQEPDDVEFYILGLMQGRSKPDQAFRGEMDGDFGHVLPQAE